MAVGGDSQSLDVATPMSFPEDPGRTIAEIETKKADQAWLVGTAVGMNPRIEPYRHGFEFDVW